jgi:hypothetical protein
LSCETKGKDKNNTGKSKLQLEMNMRLDTRTWVKLGPHKKNRNMNNTLMTKAVTKHKKVLDWPILLQLLKKEPIF